VMVVSPGLGASGRHLRDLLIAATLRLRREHPEAELLHEPQRPTRCPQCGRLHVMASGVPCPGCGAFAGMRW
jgi:rubrerythrin